MDVRRLLRVAIIVDWASIVFGVIASYALEGSLPFQHQDYLRLEREADLSVLDGVLFLFYAVLIVGHTASSVGLFFYKRWAKPVFMGVVLFGFLPLGLDTHPVVYHPIVFSLDGLVSMAVGFILALLIVTNVCDGSNRRKRRRRTP